MTQVVGFGLTGALLLLFGALFVSGPLLAPAALAIWAGVSVLLVATAYLVQTITGNGGRLFLKGADGSLNPVVLLVLLPFIVSRYVNVLIYRLFSREAAVTDVDGGLWLGGRVFPWDRGMLSRARVAAVLDVTAELPRDPGVKGGRDYVALPVLDGTGPTQVQLDRGVEWILCHMEAHRPVLVQCTMGHGRSATFAAGALLALGRVDTIDAALSLMRSKRNRVGLNTSQRRALEQSMRDGLLRHPGPA